MPIDVIMPNLGLTMEAGTVARWLVAPGEQVEAGQPLFEVETDKVSVEVEALATGVLSTVLVEAGRKVAVGTVLARIGEEDEGRLTKDEGRTTEDDAFVLRPPSSVPPADSGQSHRPLTSALRPPPPRRFSSPRARKVAGEHGIDWRALSGSGPRGRVVERDVLAATDRRASRLPGVLTAEVDLSNLLDAHRRLAPFVQGLHLVDWLAFIVGAALDESSVTAEIASASIRIHQRTMSGMARKSLAQIAAERSRADPIVAPPAAPIFRIHDFSASRIDAFLPSLLPPEIACLVVGRIAKSGHATLSFSFDDSALAGDEAVRLVETVIDLIEGPEGLLLSH